MGTLYLVRHGQASFGADDYDNLCDLGVRQSVRLGEYFAAKGQRFDAAICGTLRRHAQTFEGIREGMGAPALEPVAWPGLNEYDGTAVIAAVHPAPLERADTPEKFRRHFQMLRDGLAQWMRGHTQPLGMPSYADFQEGVAGALAHVRSNFDGNVLLVSSGGPISTAVGQVLGLAPEITIELNLRMRNSCVTEFHFNARRCSLITFNTLPHLDGPQYADWVTHA
jgi:broad specificity phosphatase PhoE